jgi:hypothetical protein
MPSRSDFDRHVRRVQERLGLRERKPVSRAQPYTFGALPARDAGGQFRAGRPLSVAATGGLRMGDMIGDGMLSEARALIRRESAACG